MAIPQVPTAMSMDYVLNHIAGRLGGNVRKIHLEDNDMATVIVMESLVEYSKYFPYVVKHQLVEADADPHELGVFHCDPGVPILSANRIVGGLDAGRSAAGGMSAGVYIGDGMAIAEGDARPSGMGMSSLIGSYARNNAQAISTMPITVLFIPPHSLEIQPKNDYVGDLVVLHCVHPPTLHTIGLEMAEQFKKLAYADVRIALRAILSKFQEIATPNGAIQLNMDELDRAEDDRATLIELFRKHGLRSKGRKRWYVG